MGLCCKKKKKRPRILVNFCGSNPRCSRVTGSSGFVGQPVCVVKAQLCAGESSCRQHVPGRLGLGSRNRLGWTRPQAVTPTLLAQSNPPRCLTCRVFLTCLSPVSLPEPPAYVHGDLNMHIRSDPSPTSDGQPLPSHFR